MIISMTQRRNRAQESSTNLLGVEKLENREGSIWTQAIAWIHSWCFYCFILPPYQAPFMCIYGRWIKRRHLKDADLFSQHRNTDQMWLFRFFSWLCTFPCILIMKPYPSRWSGWAFSHHLIHHINISTENTRLVQKKKVITERYNF